MTSSAQMQPPFDGVLEKSQRAAVEQHPVPAFGNTRCYWSLLDAELRYLYLDPACNVHMGEQAQALIGTCLLDYVHPDEQHSARADLRNVLDSRTLHGSVTRVRYSRLSRIRILLGCEAPVIFPDAHIVAEDERYIACDVVINWVSDNVVLCFLHAIVDKGKADNDENNKTQWTNWCGTSAMTTDHAAQLYSRLQSLPSSSSPPDRIFQILINQPARPILFSWPPEGYSVGEFGKLAHRMQIGGGADNSSRSEDSAKTSCTRRYKATQRIVDGGVLKDVESIFIPHGAVIFACHKVMSTGSYADSQHGRDNVSDMYQHSYQPRQQQQPSAHYLPPAHQQQPTLAQGRYDDARRNASDGDYAPSGVPDSPEYARSRISTPGYQRGPVEYGGSHYGSHNGMRNVDYAQGGGYTQQYGSPYPMNPHQPQRSETYPPSLAHSTGSRSAQDRGDNWGYAQSHPQSQTQAPAQQWPAGSQPPTPGHHGVAAYDAQPWPMNQSWPQPSADQAHGHPHQPQGYSYPTSQAFASSQLPPPQPQPPSPPPPYVQDLPNTQPPPQPVQPKRDASPQEETTPIPRIHAPPKRKREPEPKKEDMDNTQDPVRDEGRVRLSPSGKGVIARERGQSAGAAAGIRVGGGPPPGVMRCSSCQSETSPEWRKGPSGKKDLCNACGLRYARSKQKKDGFGLTKRRRDKEVPLAPAPTPPAALRHTASLPTPASSASSSSHNGNGHSWPNSQPDARDAKRSRSGTFNTNVSHSPSPPRSESLSQPEHNPEVYDGRYGPVGYPYAYQNGYGMEYGRMSGPVSSYGSQQMPPDGRGPAPTFAGQ
ncbi:hypothetical protein BDV93DRAFT_110352 [Ceratobasidium sp. AG-I]|nr:hypothetical protein BDV93DRAFT_110352 [Ceratobasidium sp. AG-I]